MRFSIFLATIAFAVLATQSYAGCKDQANCATCLANKFCGWCSPDPTVFDDKSKKGSQCQDQRESGWHCDHLYSTEKCLIGYVCDHVSGQCAQDPTGGTGDTKANCEKTCHPKPNPSGLSVCNEKTAQCEPCTDYCKANTDCPGSYCSNGLCHGSTCMSNTTCDAKCSQAVPDAMVGTWRGIAVEANFTAGEYDIKIDKSTSSGAEVMVRGPSGATSTGQITASVGLNKVFTYTFSAGPLAGKVLKGGFDSWEPAPETVQAGFYMGAAGAAAPADIHAAQANEDSMVLSMSKCMESGGKCDFDSVFSEISEVFAEAADPCNPNQNCSACIGAASGLCGWCSTPVTYSGVASKSQCAGFDSSGKPLGWQCAGKFSKSDCADYGCDFTNPAAPKCMQGAGSLTKDECGKKCAPVVGQYSCDAATKSCKPCDMHYCTSNKQCPKSYCNKAGSGPWSCHGEVPAGCTDKAGCETGCNMTETYAICDPYAGTCTPAPEGTPGATTKYSCSHTCTPAMLEGVYRGVAINSGFARGEWDFSFYSNSTLHMRSPAGKVTIVKLSGSKEAVEKGAMALEGTVVSSEDPKMSGKVYALFKKGQQGTRSNDSIVEDLFFGLSMTPVASFEAAMSEMEWSMVKCKGAHCDFSSRVVA